MANDVTLLQSFPYGGEISKSRFGALRPAIDTRGEWSKKKKNHPTTTRNERGRERKGREKEG